MKRLIYKLIYFWLNRRLREAEDTFNGMQVDRLVNATEAIQGEINGTR